MAQELTKTRAVKDEVLKSLTAVDCNYMLFVSDRDISIFIDMPINDVEDTFRELFEALEELRVDVEVHNLSMKCKITDDDDITLTNTAKAKTMIIISL